MGFGVEFGADLTGSLHADCWCLGGFGDGSCGLLGVGFWGLPGCGFWCGLCCALRWLGFIAIGVWCFWVLTVCDFICG